MKAIRNTVAVFVMILLSAHMVLGQDLSKYRTFSLGTSLANVLKQLRPNSYETTLIQQRPAVIQETTFCLMDFTSSGEKVDPVSEIVFSFYNGKLHRMVVIYDQHATEGLTPEDMVQTVSTLYGTATRPATEIILPTRHSYESREKVIAQWEDSQNSVNLFRSGLLGSFGLVVLSKRVNEEAEAAITESLHLDKKEAPQKEIERQKKEADDIERARQKNRKTFHP
jgi:hypothetical protein